MIDKSCRNSSLLKLRLDGLTYKEIGERANISRQRVQQIISPPKEVQQVIQQKFNGRCAECGILVGKSGHIHHVSNNGAEHYHDIDNLQLLCVSCHRIRHKMSPPRFCLQCGNLLKNAYHSKMVRFCSSRCRHICLRVSCKCHECEQIFEIGQGKLRYRKLHSKSGLIFCSKSCRMKWQLRLTKQKRLTKGKV